MNIKSFALPVLLISLGALAALPASPELSASAIAVAGLLAIFGGDYSRKSKPLYFETAPASIVQMPSQSHSTLPLAA